MNTLLRLSFPVLALAVATAGSAGKLRAQPIHPQWSPTGSWIAYYQRTGDRASVFIVRPDGTDREELTTGPDYDANPTWGPGGHELAFARGVGGMRQTWDIFVLDVGAERLTRLTDTPEREMHTSWSPDGRQIAFVVLTEDGSDIFVIHADGGDSRQVTFTPDREFHPKWSPDSRSLIYDSGGDDDRQIWALDVATGQARQLTQLEPGTSAAAPAWSPDGSRFTFAMRSGEQAEGLFVADADGSNVRSIDTGGLPGGASSWSPDGKRIAFHAATDGEWAIFVVPADGGETVKVSD